MDDSTMFAPDGLQPNEPVLGVYGAEEWILSEFLRRRHLLGQQTVEVNQDWIIPPSFKLHRYVIDRGFTCFSFVTEDRVLVDMEVGILIFEVSNRKISSRLIGDPQWADDWDAKLEADFKRAENLIQWVYSQRGDTISVPLNFRPAIEAAYPWINGGISNYVDNFMMSDANVLILIGPPGTGKTTFIKNMIHLAKGDAKVAYDMQVLDSDDFFAGFIEDSCTFLIMEDADNFLDSRQDGNSMMHRFLNVSDGLISAAGKKLVFSTNLPNVNSIDPALLREGRCFDVLNFRPLTREEALKVAEEAGRELRDGNEFTLAEIFTVQPSGKVKQKAIGFF